MKNELTPCSCKNPKQRVVQFAAPATYSVECSWNRGGCGKQLDDWYSKPEYATQKWNESYESNMSQVSKGNQLRPESQARFTMQGMFFN